MATIKFGTDGWRAVIGEDFTFENVKLVSQAIADYIKCQSVKEDVGAVPSPRKRGTALSEVVVGYDTRFMGKEFAEAAAGVLAANGIKVSLSDGPTSTPALSLAIKQNKLSGGIMVTASHNPPRYNGMKYKADYAGPADPGIIKEIEGLLCKNKINSISCEEARTKGLLEEIDLNKPHFRFLVSYLDMRTLRGLKAKVLVDVMHGAGGRMIENILKGAACRVTTIRSEPNPGFGGAAPEPIQRNLKELIELVRRQRYAIGLATDGDADRIGAISADGKFISSSQVISLLLVHFVEDRKWTGAVAKTISGSFLIDEIARTYNLRLYETPVGFKHICRLMQTEDVLIGGEESGGIGFKNYVPERDGALAGLLLLEMMAHRKRPIKGLLKDIEMRFGRFCQDRIDLKYPDEKKERLFSKLRQNSPPGLLNKKIIETKTYDGVKFIVEDKSWLLFRASGTEPILRIYAEARSEAGVKKLLKLGEGIAGL